MILQVIFDGQFGDYVLEQFRDYKDRTRIVLVTNKKNDLQFHINIAHSDIIEYNTEEYKELISNLSEYQAVIMHGLFSNIQYDIVRHLPQNTKLAWVLWGAEIYTRKDVYMNHIAPMTRFAFTVKKYKDIIVKPSHKDNEVPLDILRRVDYLLGSSLEIYEDVKAYIGNPNMKHLMYSYFTLERLIGADMLDKTVNGSNILLGNSSTPDNNHIDILMRLKRVGIAKEAKLITPLSYGDLWVKHLINKVGSLLFRRQFYPLLDYMPRTEYNKLVQSCSVFITNHHRPNAFGNTLTALWLGARVYTSESNIQTRFLQNMGLHVDTIERDLTCKNASRYLPHSIMERDEDRTIIRNKYGKDVMSENIKTIITTLDSNEM